LGCTTDRLVMKPGTTNPTHEVLRTQEKELLADWIGEMQTAALLGRDAASDAELRAQAQEFLRLLQTTSAAGGLGATDTTENAEIRRFLAQLSMSRVKAGFTSAQTATFLFSLKRPLFSRLRRHLANTPDALPDALWVASELIDRLGLATVQEYQKTREHVIVRQQQELLELSTPVVKMWEGVLALPMIGTLDSSRAQVVMESLLQAIVDTGSQIAIIDITGVPTVDTLVAQHLLKTVTAIRLMGADCVISGVRPQIAQTIVQLGVDLQGVTTKATLADALGVALKRSGFVVTRTTPKA
jgi:rsbT co-antagonist protein RsbR